MASKTTCRFTETIEKIIKILMGVAQTSSAITAVLKMGTPGTSGLNLASGRCHPFFTTLGEH